MTFGVLVLNLVYVFLHYKYNTYSQQTLENSVKLEGKKFHPYSRHPATVAVNILVCAPVSDQGVDDRYTQSQRWEEIRKTIKQLYGCCGIMVKYFVLVSSSGLYHSVLVIHLYYIYTIINTVCVHYRNFEVTEMQKRNSPIFSPSKDCG